MSQNRSLISVEDALNTILEKITPVESEMVPLAQSLYRVLAESITSPINVPPFANSAMDGYAVIAADIQAATPQNPTQLNIVDNIPAGGTPSIAVSPTATARIMTGAPMPAGADAVVPFEETSELQPPAQQLAENEVLIYQPVATSDNVRPAGEDIQAGQVVLETGHRLRPQDVGILAAIGQAQVPVYRRPRIAILSTGDELVTIDEPIGPGQIRNSNEYTLAALVEKYGGEAVRLGIASDTVDDLTAKIREGLDKSVDLFLTSAGVSVGDFDMVKNVLAAEGEMQFWQVAMKPGKPLAFGILQGNQHSVPLIGLPGNPVAAMVAFEVFARPALAKLSGQLAWDSTMLRAKVDEDVTNSGRRHYMRAFLHVEEDGYHVTTRGSGVQVQGSGILSSLVWANCLVVVPEEVTHIPEGATVEVWLLG
jgi:molybdopterin molybdotransferase